MRKKPKKKIVLEPTVKYVPNTKALQFIKAKLNYNLQVCIYIGKKFTEADKTSFFKASANEDLGCLFIHYKSDQYWSSILRDLGIAKSISDAKGAGWHRKVEDGFQDIYLDGLKNVTEYNWKKALREDYEKLTDEQKQKLKNTNYFELETGRPHRITILKELKDETKLPNQTK